MVASPVLQSFTTYFACLTGRQANVALLHIVDSAQRGQACGRSVFWETDRLTRRPLQVGVNRAYGVRLEPSCMGQQRLERRLYRCLGAKDRSVNGSRCWQTDVTP